jgi:hypothetical protein
MQMQMQPNEMSPDHRAASTASTMSNEMNTTGSAGGESVRRGSGGGGGGGGDNEGTGTGSQSFRRFAASRSNCDVERRGCGWHSLNGSQLELRADPYYF